MHNLEDIKESMLKFTNLQNQRARKNRILSLTHNLQENQCENPIFKFLRETENVHKEMRIQYVN